MIIYTTIILFAAALALCVASLLRGISAAAELQEEQNQ